VRSADYVFDMARFTRFEGKTGAYMLMAAVRIKSILRKAAERDFQPGAIIPPTIPSERELILQASMLADAIRLAATERAPHHLCAYAYDLSQAFSRFYNDCHILTEEDPARRASWLGLSQLVLRQLELTLGLLGIEIPDRM
jgi:arginyl-tRNA synthetase